jgi:hypothetical protein
MKMKITHIMMASMIILLTQGCDKKSPIDILKGETFYYADTCLKDSYYIDTFGDKSFTESDFNGEKQLGKDTINLVYKEEHLLISDGRESLPCSVKDKGDYVELSCIYEDENDVKTLWRKLEDAKDNKEGCE